MTTMKWHTFLFFVASLAAAADLPSDKGSVIPESAKRPVVITGKSSLELPKHDLPPGYKLELAAAAPLVTHPIMGCLDDRGRLFVGDATGVNWNKKQLEENPPNRVLMLEDTDQDGRFDKSTIFADKMTFPQGACWLKGSLYVCSPPGLWKLTDTDDDGVADQREQIVTGFDYTGNAADVHGPFLNPRNGRLYWCHGRKGHKVAQKDGSIVDESLACGIWSCKPDGSDVAWHSLGCGDNPVEVDFTPSGDIVGVQNLYYSQPRGDTIIHWLYGGVYERADQLKAIAHLPRTLDVMPVMYNFGHVAVSGACFWRRAPMQGLQYLVTHFNTQRIVRMELTPQGSTYKAVENEFLKLHNPDIHLTDVLEDPRDGSLLAIDTGGWFRIGCPSSLMAKSDLLGAVYRIRQEKPAALTLRKPVVAGKTDLKSKIVQLKSSDPHARRQALEWVVQELPENWAQDKKLSAQVEQLGTAMREMMREPLDAVLEHSLLCAAQTLNLLAVTLADLKAETNPIALRRMLTSFVPDDASSINQSIGIAAQHLDSTDRDLAHMALKLAIEHADLDEGTSPRLATWMNEKRLSSPRIKALEGYCAALIAQPKVQNLITTMLGHVSPEVKLAALRVLAGQSAGVTQEAWFAKLDSSLAEAATPLLLDAIKKLKTPHFDAALQAIANDTKRPLAIRLKALDAAENVKLTGETFDMVKGVLTDPSSTSAAKIQAAGMLAAAPMTKEQMPQISPLLASVGPVELKTLLPLLKQALKDARTA